MSGAQDGIVPSPKACLPSGVLSTRFLRLRLVEKPDGCCCRSTVAKGRSRENTDFRLYAVIAHGRAYDPLYCS